MFINQILTKLKSLVYSKSETDSLLNGKASSSHTHTKSQISDFPTIPSATSQLTNDAGFITSSGSCNYANSAGSAGKADYLGDIGSTDRNGASGTGWYSVGFSYSYDEGHGELAINNYWGIRLNCRDSNHVTINGNRIIDSANISSSLMYINGDRANNAYRIEYGTFNNSNNVSNGKHKITFSHSFSTTPTVVVSPTDAYNAFIAQPSNVSTTSFIAELFNSNGSRANNRIAIHYIAIGKS